MKTLIFSSNYADLQTCSTSSAVDGNTCLGSFNSGFAILIHFSRNWGSQDTDPPPALLVSSWLFSTSSFSFFLEETTEEDVPLCNLRLGWGITGGPLRGLWQCVIFAKMFKNQQSIFITIILWISRSYQYKGTGYLSILIPFQIWHISIFK